MLIDQNLAASQEIHKPPRPPGGRATIRVMLVEDHPLVRFGIRALLDSEPDIEVVAECGDGQAAVEQLEHARPDIVVTDLSMPGMDGAETTRRVLQLLPEVHVLVHTAAPFGQLAARALAAGADVVLAKGDLRQLVTAVRPHRLSSAAAAGAQPPGVPSGSSRW